ncbi:HK97 gp10 family phage protein [Massilia rhizosphaerae]|uniref:HK97 gp10 family phage protein n=1 Tax=Massilia rhizosphaerae TaxID=2784389 RepID=UPI0018DE5333|nr:HK97 gp10 family phage protein [Massilia rhizosphaerae]
MADLKVDGLDELHRRMAGVSERLVKNVLRSSVRKGGNVIRNQARANFNSAVGPNDLTGALKASIRVTPRRGTPTRVVVSIVAGDLTQAQVRKFGIKAAYYALWVEKGHINRKAGEALRGSKATLKAIRAASTNNTPAHPYMLPALQTKAQEAVDVVIHDVAARLPEVVQ